SDQGFKCSWPFIEHPNWKVSKDLKLSEVRYHDKKQLVNSGEIFYRLPSFSFHGPGHCSRAPGGRYSTRRKYYEPLASEVKAYSAEMGSTVQKTALDRAVFDCQEVPDFAVSIVLAMLDPLSLSLLLRCGAARLRKRHADAGLRDLPVVLMYNQTAREMSSMIASQLPILACLSKLHHLLHAVVRHCRSLVKICLLIYGLSIIVYLWMCLQQIRFLFLKSFETRREQAMSTPDTLLYESNIICLPAASGHCCTPPPGLIRRVHSLPVANRAGFRRKRVFVPRFPTQRPATTYTVLAKPHALRPRVHSRTEVANVSRRFRPRPKESLSAAFDLLQQGLRSGLQAGITCHYGMLEQGDELSHASLKALYLSLISIGPAWLGGRQVVATAHAATRQSNDED
uniref:DUF4757 domain-containing protein n=1 Tax=Macrostomum lignano TaxID=282301 RepID=A0A1I8F8Q1_9PLAT